MTSIEQNVKAKFARVFIRSDWRLFKEMADRYFERAARLRKADLANFPPERRLLARNIEKRLFIGIGTELLLKALYLKHGYVVNRLVRAAEDGPSFPFTLADTDGFKLASDKTFMLNELIQGLRKVPAVGALGELETGLRIAMVFRNKEGHGVLPAHAYDAAEYRSIEHSLVTVYERGFEQSLKVRFAMSPSEKPVWNLSGG